MESTLEQPLLYFENVVENSPVELFKQFVDSCKQDGENFKYKIIAENYENGIITINNSYIDFETNKVYNESYIDFNNNFKLELERELKKSKTLINLYIVQNPDNLKKYILLLEKNLQYILNKGVTVNQKYPDFFKILVQINKYLNDKYLFDQDFKFELSISKYDTIKTNLEDANTLLELGNGNEVELINTIFSFMSGKNEKRVQIMSEEQYSLMIKSINELVLNEELPNNIQKLKHVSISNDLLSFIFWVLHKQLYTSNKIRPYFIEFLKETFSNFDNKEISSIRKGFGTKGRVTKDVFLPKIVSQYL